MREWVLISVAIIYVVCLAIVDGVFNRLVFLENRHFEYEHPSKERIYKLREWRYLGLILLFVLPCLLPSVVAWVIGGIHYVMVYWIVLCLVQWDLIFGKILFNNWWGDTPSIFLPWLGRFWLPLKIAIWFRLLMVMGIVYLLTQTNI